MSNLILIGGATASGKSTFAKKLVENIPNSLQYRRFQAFYDLASMNNIDEKDIFNNISSKDADDYFINMINNNETLISDIHYAIQMNRNILNNIGNYNDNYVGTISDELINKLLNNNISITAIFVSCDSSICYSRAIKRYKNNEKELRNVNSIDCLIESNAERKEWDKLCEYTEIKKIELCTDIYSPDDLVEQYNNIMSENKIKKYVYKNGRKK